MRLIKWQVQKIYKHTAKTSPFDVNVSIHYTIVKEKLMLCV